MFKKLFTDIFKMNKSTSSSSQGRQALSPKQRFRNIVIYVLFGSIALVFVFFNYYGTHSVIGGYAARVNHRVITIGELEQAKERVGQFYSQFLGGAIPAAQQAEFIKEEALKMLIDRSLLADQAQLNGFQATDAQLKEWILSIPAFKKDGRFQKDYYANFLRSTGHTASQFEDQRKRDLSVEQFQRFFADHLKQSPLEASKLNQMKADQVQLEYVLFNDTQLLKGAVTSQEVNQALADPAQRKKFEELFQKNKAQYKKEGKDVDFESVKSLIAESELSKAKRSEKIQQIKKWLQASDQKELNDFVKSRGVKWQETGWFGRFDDSIPGVGADSEALKMVAKLSLKSPFLPDTVLVGDAVYVLKLKAERKEPQALDSEMDIRSQQIGSQLLSSWVEELRAKAKITRFNPSEQM